MGFKRCNICLKDFTTHERVKRFPRECDHIFHIKCLEIWLKIQASCPNCLKCYLGHQYTNPSISGTYDDHYEAERFSIFNEGESEFLYDYNKTSQSQCQDSNMTEYQQEFDMKQFSRNPFVRMAHTRQIKYMDEQKMIKNKKAEVRQQLIS